MEVCRVPGWPDRGSLRGRYASGRWWQRARNEEPTSLWPSLLLAALLLETVVGFLLRVVISGGNSGSLGGELGRDEVGERVGIFVVGEYTSGALQRLDIFLQLCDLSA